MMKKHTRLLPFIAAAMATAAHGNPIAELCPSCTGAVRMCSPDRTLKLDGVALVANDARVANHSTVRPADLHSMGAVTCDCTHGAEIYRSLYDGYLAAGYDDPHGHGRLPGCGAEAVTLTMPAAECPHFSVVEGSTTHVPPGGAVTTTSAPLVVGRGGTDANPEWSVSRASLVCVVDALTACPPGYQRDSIYTYWSTTATAPSQNVCRGYAAGSTRSNGLSVAIPVVNSRGLDYGTYVSAVSLYSFPAQRPTAGVCPDGSNLDNNLACPQEYDPLPIYQIRSLIEGDYASSVLETYSPQFFGDKDTQGNYYTEDYWPPCKTDSKTPCASLDTGVPSTNLSAAFPLMSGYLASSDVGKDMIAERTTFNRDYTTLPHFDGDDGHMCVGSDWTYSGYRIQQGKQMLDDPAIFFEDGESCPQSAPLDTATNKCVATNNVRATQAIAATSTPAVSCASGTVMPLYSGSDRGVGDVQIGEYCLETFDRDVYKTVDPDPTNSIDRACLVSHPSYPSTLPSNPTSLLNIPQAVINACKRSTLPSSRATTTHTVAHYPRTQSVSVDLRHSPSGTTGGASTQKHRIAAITTPTVTARSVTSKACRHGNMHRGWFGTPSHGFQYVHESGAFCTTEDPGQFALSRTAGLEVRDHGCDNNLPPTITPPVGTITPGGMGISASTTPGRGPIVEVLLPNGWRRAYPEVGTPEATCAAVTTEAACQGTRGCAWGNGACSNRGFNLIPPDCGCATYTGGSACPPAFPDACPSP